MTEKWIVGEPGGPAGPFWSVVSSSGRVIAMQIVDEKYAHLLAKLGPILDYDFDTVREAGRRLRQIIERDFSAPSVSASHPLGGQFKPVDAGSEDYIIRAVIEALFGPDSG